MNPEFHLALSGPDPLSPCGISDYVQTLLPALRDLTPTEFLPYRAVSDPYASARFNAVLIHYERSLVPHSDFLRDLCRKHPAVFVVPHEVYDQDPFAFPATQVRGTFGTLWAKRLLYAWRHRDYAGEIRLQENGYHARGIFPLNRGVLDILKQRCPGAEMTVVPHAMYPMPGRPANGGRSTHEGHPYHRSKFFPDSETKLIVGIFGFLTPAQDYETLLDAVAESPGTALLVLGGSRAENRLEGGLRKAISGRNLDRRVAMTGFIPEKDLGFALAVPDAFVFPVRFKSSSGSLLRLLDSGKPILAADIPLTRELRDEGAPLSLYRGRDELVRAIEAIRSGKSPVVPNRYAHSFASAAKSYVDRMRTALNS